jgi:hypothetical protein
MTWNGVDSFTRATPFASGYYNSNDSRYIASGEAIMVNFPASGSSFQINEADKVTANTSNNFRPLPGREIHQLQTVLSTVTNNETLISDGALILFDNRFSNGADVNDMLKLGNFKENLLIERDSKLLAIERRKFIDETDTIFYGVYRMEQKQYQLKFMLNNIEEAAPLCAFLEDTYLRTKTTISIQGETVVDFTVTADAGSYAKDRFRLVFRRAVNFATVNAAVLNNDIKVDWKVTDEFNISQYEIERSTNGINFGTKSTVISNGNSNEPVSYNWIDAKPVPGEYYYRIKCVSNNGVVVYSDVAKVKVVKNSPALYVFPNPVTNGTIQLQLNNAVPGKYSTRLFNSTGQLINAEEVTHPGGTATHIIKPRQALSAGNYQLEVTMPDKKTSVIQVVAASY